MHIDLFWSVSRRNKYRLLLKMTLSYQENTSSIKYYHLITLTIKKSISVIKASKYIRNKLNVSSMNWIEVYSTKLDHKLLFLSHKNIFFSYLVSFQYITKIKSRKYFYFVNLSRILFSMSLRSYSLNICRLILKNTLFLSPFQAPINS